MRPRPTSFWPWGQSPPSPPLSRRLCKFCLGIECATVQMLFVVVAEFFICWTPMYVLQTWFVFDDAGAVQHISAGAMNLVHLLGFASTCCHPITYGFMNASFRRGFVAVFCRRKLAGGGGLTAFDDDRVQTTRRPLTSFVDREHSIRPGTSRNFRVD